MKNNRIFIPGSEWLYLKIYTGSTTADHLIINNIYNIVNLMEKKSISKKWFFIRYQDPYFHLRVRFLLNDPLNIGYVLNLFYKQFLPFIQSGEIWKLQVDTYNREIERYKQHLMEATETLFHIDSIYIIKLLKILYRFSDCENLRWLFSLVMIDMLLTDFEFSLKEKANILKELDESYKIEFGYNKFNAKQLNVLYRQYTPQIRKLVERSTKEYSQIYNLLDNRSKQMQIIALSIKDLDKRKELKELIFSYIHMMMNRMFRSRNRLCELLVYNFLHRHYISTLARNNQI